MRAKANPTLIGAFVVGAVALAVILVVLLGSGRLFRDTRQFVVVFDSSLHGLSVGAPVSFRGVPVGQVTSITPVIDAEDGELEGVDMIVAIELNRGQIRSAAGDDTALDTEDFSDAELAKFFDEQGVRAQLALQSFLTGQLFVNLDFFPNSPLSKTDVKTTHPQIATIETGFQRLGRTIDTLPLDQMVEKLTSTLDGLDKIVNAAEIPSILAATERTAQSAERIAAGIEHEIEPLLQGLRETAAATTGAMQQAQATLEQTRDPANDVLASMIDTAEAAEQTFSQAQRTIRQLEELIGTGSPERQRLQSLLSEATGAARSVRLLADYLERHPESLLQGKRR